MISIILYILTIGLSFTGFIYGLDTNFFGTTDDKLEAKHASLLFGILIILAGDKLARFSSLRSYQKEQKELLSKHFNQTPELNVIEEFKDCDTAMEYLSSQIPFARIIKNTKISGDKIESRVGVASKFERALKEAIRQGVTYKDIVSPSFENYAKDLQDYAQGKNGSYSAKIMNNHPKAFINFIYMELKNEEEDLVLGWATSEARGNEQRAYRIKDKRVISYFKSYHEDLSN